MTTLVEGDEPPLRNVARQPLPVARVRAEAVKQEQRRLPARAGHRHPLEIVQADSISFEPAVSRGAH